MLGRVLLGAIGGNERFEADHVRWCKFNRYSNIYREYSFIHGQREKKNVKYFVCITFRYGGKPEELDTKNCAET